MAGWLAGVDLVRMGTAPWVVTGDRREVEGGRREGPGARSIE